MEDEQTNNARAIEQEAVAWVQLIASGRATADDVELLERWRAQSAAHESAFADASRLWNAFGPAAGRLRRRGVISAGLPERADLHAVMTRRAIVGGALGGAVAAVAGYGVIHPPLKLWPSFDELTADYRTATGEQRQLAFGEHVSVRLNTRTSVAVRASPEQGTEQIELITGEAAFDTTRQRDRRLVVLADDGRITAAGAHFDVRRMATQVCVTCLDGEVGVERSSAARSIGKGQQIRYGRNGLGNVVAIDLEVVTAWQRGVLIFRSTPLPEVVEEINRYRPGLVVMLDGALKTRLVSGTFRIDHMDEILRRLDQAFGIKSRSLPGGVVLLS